jgi:heptosyltransferase-2
LDAQTLEILNGKEKILVIQTAFPGDAILTLPMIQKLKEKYPNSSVDVVSIPATKEIFEYSPYVDKVIPLDKKGNQKSVLQLISFVNNLKKNNYTKLYSPHRSFRTSLMVYLLNVKESFGFDNASLSFVYNHVIRYDKTAHEVSRNLKLIGIEPDDEKWKIIPEINSSKEIDEKIFDLTNNISLPIVAIAPGSVWHTKKYPEEYFEMAALHLIERNYFVVFIGGKEDYELCERLHQNLKSGSQNFTGLLNIIESIQLLRQCKLLICNDSAPTHMGMAARIPVLTIYCSTIPDFGFYPYNEKSFLLSLDGLKCKPCGIHGRRKCPIKTFDCGFKLLPNVLIEKINLLLPL